MEITCLSLLVMLCLGVHGSSSNILQRQKRNWIIDSFTIDEGYEGSFPYLLGKIKIEKNLTIFKIHGQGVDEDPQGLLKIDEHTGEIYVQAPVDHEEFQTLKLMFQALDRYDHVVDTQLGIDIKILDTNDNAPVFSHNTYTISIRESTLQETEVITFQATDADSTKNNRKFDFRIVSVTPEPQDMEFYLNYLPGSPTGTVSFKGCLDHEKAEKYIVIVEAKDHGKPRQLSSSCTIIINIKDGNNHLPVITGQTGPGKVKEGQTNVLVTRLHIRDKDTRGTAAWRAKYQIQGDTNNNFRITTDPQTNDGLLYVDKYLNYEDSPVKKLKITVENEISYYTCEVKARSATGRWQVVTITDKTGQVQPVSHQVTVIVEDVNEAPVFDISKKTVMLVENTAAGRYLETFNATDPDIKNTFVYRKGEDPADWVTVDSRTGKVTTSKSVDRESSFVKDSIYVVTVHAVDDGKPQMTGTATLNIQITDENDNAPSLVSSNIDMCQSSKPSLANITALDQDENPYSGPFHFKLLGDVEGKWRVNPMQGYSVNLVKENTVHSGLYELLLEVSDLQGKTAVHNLSVAVCNCLDTTRPNCRIQRVTGTTAGPGALGVVFLTMLLVAGLLLLAFLISCKKESIEIPEGDSGQHLMISNTENLGTDCTVTLSSSRTEEIPKKSQVNTAIKKSVSMGAYDLQAITKATAATVSRGYSKEYAMSQNEFLLQQQKRKNLNWMITDSVDEGSHTHQGLMERTFTRGSSMRTSMGASSAMRSRYQQRKSTHESWMGHSQQSQEIQLTKMLNLLQVPEKELGDYEPHVYTDEGDTEHNFKLDAISISDDHFDPDLDLDSKFKALASICMPTDIND